MNLLWRSRNGSCISLVLQQFQCPLSVSIIGIHISVGIFCHLFLVIAVEKKSELIRHFGQTRSGQTRSLDDR